MEAVILADVFYRSYEWFGLVASIIVVLGGFTAAARYFSKKGTENVKEMIDAANAERDAKFLKAEEERNQLFKQVTDVLIGAPSSPFDPHPQAGLIEKVDNIQEKTQIIDEKADAAARTALVAVQKIEAFIKIWTPNGLDTNNFGDVLARMAQQQGAWLEDGVCDIKDIHSYDHDEEQWT